MAIAGMSHQGYTCSNSSLFLVSCSSQYVGLKSCACRTLRPKVTPKSGMSHLCVESAGGLYTELNIPEICSCWQAAPVVAQRIALGDAEIVKKAQLHSLQLNLFSSDPPLDACWTSLDAVRMRCFAHLDIVPRPSKSMQSTFLKPHRLRSSFAAVLRPRVQTCAVRCGLADWIPAFSEQLKPAPDIDTAGLPIPAALSSVLPRNLNLDLDFKGHSVVIADLLKLTSHADLAPIFEKAGMDSLSARGQMDELSIFKSHMENPKVIGTGNFGWPPQRILDHSVCWSNMWLVQCASGCCSSVWFSVALSVVTFRLTSASSVAVHVEFA